jgi:ADP-ribose pyrophosphatase YjhB (NUDIX family)
MAKKVLGIVVGPGDTTVLLTIPSGEQDWVLPGGLVPHGMSSPEALKRLVYRQTGLIVQPYAQLGRTITTPEGDTLRVYMCQKVSGRLRTLTQGLCFVNKLQVTSFSLSDQMRELVLDGLSILEEPIPIESQHPSGSQFVLSVDHMFWEFEDEHGRLSWLRLSMDPAFISLGEN